MTTTRVPATSAALKPTAQEQDFIGRAGRGTAVPASQPLSADQA